MWRYSRSLSLRYRSSFARVHWCLPLELLLSDAFAQGAAGAAGKTFIYLKIYLPWRVRLPRVQYV
jgi:hypothetical protein